ncbi:unnamed protein product [Ectocarpus sp. CCAP 1310/34]|nr:unnamed protein product [Ectocarpus sp. CCAP 1310/34]
MASRSGYKSLPDSAAEEDARTADAEQQVAAAGAPRPAAPGKGEDPPVVGGKGSGGSSSSGGGSSKATTTTAGREKKDPAASSADGGGGELPTAQGIFVGDPVSQSTPYHAAPPAHATVITSAPASYDHVAAAAAAAAGDGRGIAVPSGGGGQHTVIVMNAPPPGHQFGEWGRQPQAFVCRACGFTGLSLTMTDPCSNIPILAAACCCLVGCWPCSFVPFLIPELRDTVHRCPNCHVSVGRSRQFD